MHHSVMTPFIPNLLLALTCTAICSVAEDSQFTLTRVSLANNGTVGTVDIDLTSKDTWIAISPNSDFKVIDEMGAVADDFNAVFGDGKLHFSMIAFPETCDKYNSPIPQDATSVNKHLLFSVRLPDYLKSHTKSPRHVRLVGSIAALRAESVHTFSTKPLPLHETWNVSGEDGPVHYQAIFMSSKAVEDHNALKVKADKAQADFLSKSAAVFKLPKDSPQRIEAEKSFTLLQMTSMRASDISRINSEFPVPFIALNEPSDIILSVQTFVDDTNVPCQTSYGGMMGNLIFPDIGVLSHVDNQKVLQDKMSISWKVTYASKISRFTIPIDQIVTTDDIK